MQKGEVLKIVKQLGLDKNYAIFENGVYKVWIYRPAKLSKRFENYDITKNFQIWLKEGNREFRPNHLRVLIDLNLRVRSRPDLKRKLMQAFDNIYYGSDPEIEVKLLEKEKFEHYLNPITIIAILAQLLHVEQEYNYNKESKFDPPNLFLQGWIRQFIDSPKEIDNLCMSVANRQPPIAKYVNKENGKSRNHQPNLPPLWYLDE